MPLKNTKNYSTQVYFEQENLFHYKDDYNFFQNSLHRELPLKSEMEDILKMLEATTSSTTHYTLFHKINYKNIVSDLVEHADYIRKNFTDVIIIAMGGAHLNPQAVLSLQVNKKIKFHYLNTTDTEVFEELVTSVNLNDTAVIVISKSGETVETISLFSALFIIYKDKKIKNYEKHFYFIVSNTNNYLNNKAKELAIITMPHSTSVGGRYSGFTSVTVFPGLIAGLDMEAFIEGANTVLESFWEHGIKAQAFQAAISILTCGKSIAVSLAYSNKLKYFLDWYTQIISESLGKNSKGITPLAGLGPQDQHCLLQLYLDGPKDKIFTLFNINKPIDKDFSTNLDEHLNGKSLNEIHRIFFEATLESLNNNNLPVRSITLPKLNEQSLGALMMHVTLEVILCGLLMKINPFDQPGVEQIKTKAANLIK